MGTTNKDAHTTACESISAIKQMLANDEILELTVSDGKQKVTLSLFFADSIGTLSEALDVMYEQHKQESIDSL